MSHEPVLDLYRRFAEGRIGRREFMRTAAKLGIAGAATSAVGILSAAPSEASLQQAAQAAAATTPLDLAEWSYFWLGVQRAKLAKGTVVNGEQMYVESLIPAQVRHPFSIVMVHGGGGQGLDWMTTPDGRPGWAHHLVMQGYSVYVVDRPGHGRSPFHPDLHGPFGARAGTYDNMSRQFTAPEKAPMPYGAQAKLHMQWPGSGVAGDPTLDQVAAGQGGAFVPDIARTHTVWAERAAELLDKIGPAVIMTHSAGGPFAWIAANARPNLVVGLLPVEPAGPPFGNLLYGVAASPLAFDPPIAAPSELKTVEVKPTEADRTPYLIQAEPARRLKNLQGIPIGLTTSPASYHYPYDLGTVAFLKQAGCAVTHIELEKIGVTGNAHFMMMERNNREVLQPLLDFLQKTVTPYAEKKIGGQRPRSAAVRAGDSTAVKLADFGNFWIGTERKEMPYGTIAGAASFVQYLIPADVRYPLPVVLVHGGSAQMLHYMGSGDGASGWAHHFVQAGYKVYLVDRPGHGRGVYHPETLGPIGPIPTYEELLWLFQRTSKGPNKQWPGTGEIGDPLIDQFMANQNALPANFAPTLSLGAAHGAALLDKIGPAIVQTHSAAGTWGWLVAEARPSLCKAVIAFEGAGVPLVDQPGGGGRAGGAGRGGAPAAPATRRLNGVNGMPMLYFTAENSGRTDGPAIVAALAASGAKAEHVFLKDRGLRGNGHMAMLENNRKQIADFLRAWIQEHVTV
jgi:pimeloyl-ACP methyl ester carboxylesterase